MSLPVASVAAAILAASASVAPPSPASPFDLGRDIVVDGSFGTGEWSDARRQQVGDGIVLLTKRHDRYLLIGVELAPGQLRYFDLYVEDANDRTINLHASMRQGERQLPHDAAWNDSYPAFSWGPFPSWQTSVAQGQADVPQGAAIDQRLLPIAGYELKIPARHLGPSPWKMRVEIRDFRGVASDIEFPATSNRNDRSTWLDVEFP